jgi:chemotaxis family two-component system sensor histidine kinase/response regulator PixL
MNNLVGNSPLIEMASLQNEQLQKTVQELLRRFAKFQEMGHDLRALSDQMLVAPERHSSWTNGSKRVGKNLFILCPISLPVLTRWRWIATENYTLLQASLEEIVQLEERVGDVVLAGQSNQTLERQRQMLGHLRDDLMWARMLPWRSA